MNAVLNDNTEFLTPWPITATFCTGRICFSRFQESCSMIIANVVGQLWKKWKESVCIIDHIKYNYEQHTFYIANISWQF